jgi:hypothetical protein
LLGTSSLDLLSHLVRNLLFWCTINHRVLLFVAVYVLIILPKQRPVNQKGL